MPRLNADQVDDGEWISNWAQTNGSAVDVWGGPELVKKIKDLTKSGAKFQVVTVSDSDMHQVARLAAKSYFEMGFKELAFEDNADQAEMILVKGNDDRRGPASESRTRRASKLVDKLLGSPAKAKLKEDGEDGDEGEGGEENLTAEKVVEIIKDSLLSDAQADFPRVATYDEDGIMTRDAGLVLYAADGTTWQLTIVQGRSR